VGLAEVERRFLIDVCTREDAFLSKVLNPFEEQVAGGVDEDWALTLGKRSRCETAGYHASHFVHPSANTYSCDVTLVHIDVLRYMH